MATAIQTLTALSEDPDVARQAREREDSLRLYEMSLAASEARGAARGEARVRRQAIVDLCEVFRISLTPLRNATLDAPDADLDAIWRSVLRERRWPDGE